MRHAVLVLGILGALIGGFFGFRWLKEVHDPETKLVLELAKAVSNEKAKEAVSLVEYRKTACYFMLAALPLGFAGGTFGFLRKGLIAGILLLIAFLGPLVIAFTGPGSAIVGTVIFLLPLLVGGILAFFVKPDDMPLPAKKKAKPSKIQKKKDEDEEEEEDD